METTIMGYIGIMEKELGTTILGYMGGCQSYGPFLGTLNIRGRIIIGDPKRDHNFDNHPYLSINGYIP